MEFRRNENWGSSQHCRCTGCYCFTAICGAWAKTKSSYRSSWQQQARTEARLNQILSTYEFNQDEIGVENTPWEDQSEIQRYIREQRQVYYWVVNENNFYQYQAGLLSEELWEREARHTATQWNHCHLRHVFEGLEIMKSFETYVRNLTNNCGDSADENTGIIPRFQ